ncbi:MAG TPA: hypothetical protein VE650_17490 [Acetobacteraceae bacterium]|nr:hypothetical protein [Acetobacteraceae bacterium]
MRLGTTLFEWPFQSPDPEKPMCLGVQTTTWGDGKGNYTGNCRFGSPLGPMQAAIRAMDRRMAIGRAREAGMSESAGSKLLTELNTIAGLNVVTGQKRIKRYAISETRAADDGSADKPKPSLLKRQAVLCAIFGAIGGGYPALWSIVAEHKLPAKETIKNFAVGCATGITAPPVLRWAKNRGFDLEA